jgi:hypothetical protein
MAKRAKKAVQAPVNPAKATRPLDYGALVAAIGLAHQTAQAHTVQAVNVALTLRNWLIGYHLFEYEQNGSDRAKYGERLLEHLGQRGNRWHPGLHAHPGCHRFRAVSWPRRRRYNQGGGLRAVGTLVWGDLNDDD